ncbi:MAG: DHHA2 domain-containing protein [Myxococcota bacterium]
MSMRRSCIHTGWALAILLTGCPAPARSVQVSPRFEGVYFVGHLTPDTDSIASALGAAWFFGGIAARSGPMNAESRYLLERFGVAPPRLIEDWTGLRVFLLDHNQTTQAPPHLHGRQIAGVIDHHALREQAFVTEAPILIDIRPWGSTCTLLADRMLAAGRAIPEDVAGVLLGGILSDTLHLSSPTTTEADRRMVPVLAGRAGLSGTTDLFEGMMRAKSDLSGLTAVEVLTVDFKVYVLGGLRVGVGVAETITPEEVLSRQTELIEAMAKVRRDRQLDLLYFAVTDVVRKRMHLVGAGEDERRLAARAFEAALASGETPEAQRRVLEGVTSRKRQLVPALERALRSPTKSGAADAPPK